MSDYIVAVIFNCEAAITRTNELSTTTKNEVLIYWAVDAQIQRIYKICKMPYTTTDKIPVILEYSADTGKSWNFISNVNATAGHFSYNWTTNLPTDDPYVLVRGRWQGDPAQLLDIAVTMPQPLTFM